MSEVSGMVKRSVFLFIQILSVLCSGYRRSVLTGVASRFGG